MRNTMGPAAPGALPPWSSVLAVVAHPDDESFGLGALLDAFVQAGSVANVLCFTRGEASTLQGVPGDLTVLRAQEFERAADILGVENVMLGDHPDGALDAIDRGVLVSEIQAAVTRHEIGGLLVFDPSGISGHPDHIAATAAAVEAAEPLGLPVLSWSLPDSVAQKLTEEFEAGFIGRTSAEIDLVVPVSRDRQREASWCWRGAPPVNPGRDGIRRQRPAGENVAWGQPNADSAFSGGMGSAGHKANILNAKFTPVGVAKAAGPDGPHWVMVLLG